MSNILLLVNSSIQDTELLSTACLPNVSFMLYDQRTDTYAGLLQRIAALNVPTFTEVGIIFEGRIDMINFSFLNDQPKPSMLIQVQTDDQQLQTWSAFINFLNTLKTTYSMQTLDFFGCYLYSNPNWQYVFNTIITKLGILIQASTDATGNEKTFIGGVTTGADWIMESNGVNIKDTYFNDNITNYQYNFGGAQGQQISAVIINGIPYTAGYNNLYGLGNGTNRGTYTLNYTPMTNLPVGLTAIDIAVTSTCTFVIFSDGKVYGCGGMLSVQNSTLALVQNAPVGKIASFLSASYYTIMVVFDDGSIYSIGKLDNYGEMGGTYPTGTNDNSATPFSYNSTPMPIPLSGLIPIKVMRNDGNTLILYSNSAGGNNRVFICGFNNWGQYGNGTTSTSSNTTLTEIVSPNGLNPINICSCKLATVIQYSNNTIYMCGILTGDMFGNPIGTPYNTLTQVNLSSLPAGVTPVDVSAMHRNMYIIGSNGKLYANGVNGWGQLGIGSDSNNNNLNFPDFALVSTLPSNLTVTNVNANQDGVIVLCNDNSVYGTGQNQFGNLAIGTLGAPWSGAPGGQVNSMTRSVAPTAYKVILANQSISTLVVTATPPPAPTALSATSPDQGQVQISFTQPTASATITNYQYSTDGTNYTVLSPVDATSPVTISGLPIGVTYNIYIQAINSAGAGTASSAVSISLPALAPAAPTGLSATAGSAANTIVVSFTPGATNGSAVTNYNYSINSGVTWLTTNQTTSPLTLGSIYPFSYDVSYNIILQQVNAIGTSPASSSINTRLTSGAPSAPTNVILTSSNRLATPTSNEISISFTGSSPNGSTIANYQYSLDAGHNTWTSFSPAQTTSPVTITGLSYGTPYNVELRAINASNVTGAASSNTAITLTAVPTVPTNLATTVGNQQVSLAFTPSLDNGATVDYQYTTNGGVAWTNASSTTSPIVITGLTNGTTYSVGLRAHNSAGYGTATGFLSARPVYTPSAPASLSAVAGNQTVTINFTAFTSVTNGGTPITGYQYSIDNSHNVWSSVTSSTATSVTVDKLTNGTTYSMQIRALNAQGDGAASSAVSFTPTAAPAAPTITAASNNAITFTLGANNGVQITRLAYSINNGSSFTTIDISSNATSLTIPGLTYGNLYPVQIKAINSVGTGVASNTVNTTIAPQVPSAPTNFSVSNRVVTFTAGATNGSDITNYEYSIDASHNVWTAFNPVDVASPVTMSTFTAGVTYSVQLRAVNSVGSGAASATFTVLPFTTPAAPKLTSAVNNVVTFTAGATNGSAITNYKYSIDNGNTFTAFSPAVTASPVTIPDLITGTTYGVKLKAVNVAGSSVESNMIPVLVVPSTPNGVVKIINNGTTTLTVTNNLTDANGINGLYYNWHRNGTLITGSAGASYTLVKADDKNTTITAKAHYTNTNGTSNNVTSFNSVYASGSQIKTGSLLDGYISGATVTIVDLSGNVLAGPVTTDATGNYDISYSLITSAAYIIKCVGGTDIATGLPSVYPLTAVLTNSSATDLNSASVPITPLTTLVATIAVAAIANGDPSIDPSTLVSSATSSVATALNMNPADVAGDYIANVNLAASIAAVKVAAVTAMLATATTYTQEQINQSIATTISDASTPLAFDSTTVNSVVTAAAADVTQSGGTPPALSAILLANISNIVSTTSNTLNAINNPGSFETGSQQLASIYKTSVGSQQVVTTNSATLSSTAISTASIQTQVASATSSATIGTISTEPVFSNVCFAKNTMITTDQGEVEIQHLTTQNTIDNMAIRMVTKTQNIDDYMVLIKQDAITENVPCKDTYVSGEHMVLYNEQMIKSKNLINATNIQCVPLKKQTVYNIVFDNTTDNKQILANNMMAESLDPNSPFVELLAMLNDPKLSNVDREEQIHQMNKMLKAAHEQMLM